MAFISDDGGETYNRCHCEGVSSFPPEIPWVDRFRASVWSNFEIGDLDFWRGEAYTKFVEFLDEKGGFYYEVGHRDLGFRSTGNNVFLLIALGRRTGAQYWRRIVCAQRSDPLFQRGWIPPQPIHGTVNSVRCVTLGTSTFFFSALPSG